MMKNWATAPRNTSRGLHRQGSTHAEHDNAQEEGEDGDAAYFTQYPFEIFRHGEAENQEQDGDDAEILADHGA